MKRPLAAIVAVLAGSLIAATPRSIDSAALLDEGDAALARGDYGLAESLFERAEPRAADPGRATLGLAAAKYRLALAMPGRGELLSEAEALYRSCLDPDDPDRTLALVGLGNCLVRESASHDAGAAWSAAERFAEAGRGNNAELAEVARHNLQRARLLARQIPTAPPDKSDKPPSGDDSEHDRRPPESAPQPQELADHGDGKRAGARAANADPGKTATATDETRAPGKGELPPVPDRDGQPLLTAPEARQHLEQAARRIMEEARQHRRSNIRPSAPGVPDW
jgi:tetratricopeptide (TPR) repeat protein